MTSRDFAYWLQGFFELVAAGTTLSGAIPTLEPGQIDCIKKHLALVFKHEIDPGMGSVHHQQELTDIHHPVKPHGPHSEPLSEEQQKIIKDFLDKFPTRPGLGGIKINC